jgi:aspartyl-tRNA synthetase
MKVPPNFSYACSQSASAACLMDRSPSEIEPEALKELKIRVE